MLLLDAILIINKNGQLSACATKDEFESLDFFLENMLIVPVRVSRPVLTMLQLARQTVWLAGADLPSCQPQPGRVYLAIHEGKLFPMKKGV